MRIIFGEMSKIPYQIVSISLIIVSITVDYLFKKNSTYLSFCFINIKHIRPYQTHDHHGIKFFTMFRHTMEIIVEFCAEMGKSAIFRHKSSQVIY